MMRDEINLLEEIRNEIDKEVEGGNHADDYVDGYEDGLLWAISVIDAKIFNFKNKE